MLTKIVLVVVFIKRNGMFDDVMNTKAIYRQRLIGIKSGMTSSATFCVKGAFYPLRVMVSF